MSEFPPQRTLNPIYCNSEAHYYGRDVIFAGATREETAVKAHIYNMQLDLASHIITSLHFASVYNSSLT